MNNFGTSLLSRFQPYFIGIIVIVGIVCLIKSLRTGKYIDIIFEICIIAVVISFVSNPEMFLKLGEFITSFIAETFNEDMKSIEGGVI